MLSEGWLIYHLRRKVSRAGTLTVYHDSLSGNQDPYIWNRQFLHTTCHMSQMTPEVGQVEIWVSGDTFPAFNELRCDLVLVVQDKIYWKDPNYITPDDPMVDSLEAFVDHYQWIPIQHPYKRRRRFTLKADAKLSFQPQTLDNELIDIVPVLKEAGLSKAELRAGLRAGFLSKPLRITSDVSRSVYEFLSATAGIQLSGSILERTRLSKYWPPELLPRSTGNSALGSIEVGHDSRGCGIC